MHACIYNVWYISINLCVMKSVCVSHTVTLSDVLNSFLNCHLDSIVSAGGSINSTDIFELAQAFALPGSCFS